MDIVTEKVCSLCGESKPFKDYSKNKTGKYRLRQTCKSCDAVVSKVYRDSHRAEKHALDKRYKAEHREQSRVYNRKSKKKRRKKVSFYNRVRGESSWVQWLTLLAFYGAKCLRCSRMEFEVDHILPVSMGGSGQIDNLQPLCKSCNRRKNDTYADYRPDKGEFARILKLNSV